MADRIEQQPVIRRGSLRVIGLTKDIRYLRFLANSTEPDMVALFLKTEIEAPRYATELLQLLERDGMDRTIVDTPDITNAADNAYRLQLLTDFRGYSKRQGYFQGFPDGVTWQRVVLSPDELLQARYINYDYWVELSGGSRRASDAAHRIRAGRTVFDVSNDGFLALADGLRHGAVFPDLILVWAGKGTTLVVLEGHARLTAYALVPETIPSQVPVLLGTSVEMSGWDLY